MDKNIPKHVAVIMDGNGRWAKKRGLLRVEGHRRGADTLEKILRHSVTRKIQNLTVYAFSTENWKRPKAEVSALMKLFSKYLDSKKDELGIEAVFAVPGKEKWVTGLHLLNVALGNEFESGKQAYEAKSLNFIYNKELI